MFEQGPYFLYVKISIRMDLKRLKCTLAVNASASASRGRGAQSAHRHLTKIVTTQNSAICIWIVTSQSHGDAYNSLPKGKSKVAQERPGSRRQRGTKIEWGSCHKTCLDGSGAFKGVKIVLNVQSLLNI